MYSSPFLTHFRTQRPSELITLNNVASQGPKYVAYETVVTTLFTWINKQTGVTRIMVPHAHFSVIAMSVWIVSPVVCANLRLIHIRTLCHLRFLITATVIKRTLCKVRMKQYCLFHSDTVLLIWHIVAFWTCLEIIPLKWDDAITSQHSCHRYAFSICNYIQQKTGRMITELLIYFPKSSTFYQSASWQW